MRHYKLLFGVAVVAVMGLFSNGGIQEVSASGADSLVGGAGCSYWKITLCNPTPKTGCPSSTFFRKTTVQTISYGKATDKATCGCVKKPATGCNATTGFQHVGPCGSSGGSGSGDLANSGMDP